MIDELPVTLPVGEYDYSKAEAQFLAEQARSRARRGVRMPFETVRLVEIDNGPFSHVDALDSGIIISRGPDNEVEMEIHLDRTDIRPVNAVFYFVVVFVVFVMLLFVLSLLGTLIR